MLYIENNSNSHYCWIKNFSRLVKSQITKHKESIWFCDGCLVNFIYEAQLKRHQEHDCNKVKTNLPNPNKNKLFFKNYPNKIEVPFIIYCDFEAILKPISNSLDNIDDANVSHQDIQRHEPFSFAYYIKCSYDENLSKFKTYRGLDCTKVFIEQIKKDLSEINNILKNKATLFRINCLSYM